MRKITSEAVEAFKGGKYYKNTNTEIAGYSFYLHGNKIAEKRDGEIDITLAGWNTNTTRERLNGLDGVRVTTRQGQAYLNGKAWDGEWITIK